MTLRLLQENNPEAPMVVGLTVDQYHQMIARGILEEGAPIELLDGLLVRKDRSKTGESPMTVGHHHAWAVRQLVELNPQLAAHGCFISVQQPIAIPPDNEPEPDGAIVRGDPSAFRNAHPTSSDVICAIEVADSSLNHDRTTKQRIYAEAGIGQFVLLNLVDGILELRTNPLPGEGRYGNIITLNPDQTLSLVLADGATLQIPARRLLP